MTDYNVPADWQPVHHTVDYGGDFIGDRPRRIQGPLIGWLTPDQGFISPDKLPDQYRIKLPNVPVDADGSGRLLPEIPVQSKPDQILEALERAKEALEFYAEPKLGNDDWDDFTDGFSTDELPEEVFPVKPGKCNFEPFGSTAKQAVEEIAEMMKGEKQ